MIFLRPLRAFARVTTALVAVLLIGGCASRSLYQVDLMPVPDGFEEYADAISPYAENAPFDGMLYVTDRAIAADRSSARFYDNERGSSLRVGLAEVSYSGEPKSIEELQALATAKTPDTDHPLSVSKAEDLGYLRGALPYGSLTAPAELANDAPADTQFAALINDKLEISRNQQIYLFVHGYKVNFEDPILVGAQLWHFMGYEGVFIPFAWPSTPNRLAYFRDIETAQLSARNLRLLIRYLLLETDAEKVNIVGYSAGARVVVDAMHQLALTDIDRERIGQVALVGSDYDRQRWAAAVVDGVLDVSDQLTVYVSGADLALRVSQFVFRQGRLGRLVQDTLPTHLTNWFRRTDKVAFVDVTNVESAVTGNGHSYFRNSPVVSSDLLAVLLFGFSPDRRGLRRGEDQVAWSFPDNYRTQLAAAIESEGFD